MKQLAIGYTVRKGQSESRIQKLGSELGPSPSRLCCCLKGDGTQIKVIADGV